MRSKNIFFLVAGLVFALIGPVSVALSSPPPGKSVKETLDVAIIGGGPTGLSTALSLLRGAPEATTNMAVFEADSFMPKGASIVVSSPGWRALKCIDPQVCRKAKREGAAISALFFKDFSGKDRLPRPVRLVIRSLYPILRFLDVGIVKSNGWHALRNTLRQGAIDASLEIGYDYGVDAQHGLIRPNMKLKELSNTYDGKVLLTFEDGTQVSASIVLACDGTFSTVRKCLEKSTAFPSKPFLIDEHRTVWRGTAPNVNVKNIGTFYVASPRGSGEGKSATAAIFPAGKTTPGSSISIVMPSVAGRASGSDEARVRLKSALSSLGPIDHDILKTIDGVDHMLEHKLHVRDFNAHPSLASGHERIAFLGDSAHPLRPTGEGVAVAMEDAWKMGKLAKDAAAKRMSAGLPVSGDIFTPELLHQYVVEREERVKAICEAVREFAESFYDDSEGASAFKHDEVMDGKLKTRKDGVNKAMKRFPIDLEPLSN